MVGANPKHELLYIFITVRLQAFKRASLQRIVMKLTRRLTPIALFTTVLLLQACAAAVVSDANKDTTGNYDGKWNATV